MQQPACGTMVHCSKINRTIKILCHSMLWALWAALRETLQTTSDYRRMQQRACDTMVPWSKTNCPVKILFLSMLWALWDALRGTLQIIVDLSCMQQPACGIMVPWQKINRLVKIFSKWVVGTQQLVCWTKAELSINSWFSELSLWY